MMTIGVNFAFVTPSVATGDPAIQIGGGNLGHVFLSKISMSRKGGCLDMASPYINATESLLIPELKHLDHRRINLKIFTGSKSNMEEGGKIINAYPWNSKVLRNIKNLHAKMLLWRGRDGFNCALIGSQNLTRAGFYHNAEAGVLIGGHKKREVDDVLDCCAAHLQLLATGSHTQI